MEDAFVPVGFAEAKKAPGAERGFFREGKEEIRVSAARRNAGEGFVSRGKAGEGMRSYMGRLQRRLQRKQAKDSGHRGARGPEETD
jgi:hypothetical protein